MRAGLVASVIGHIGAVMMTMLAWEARSVIAPAGVSVVPVEIVDVAMEANVRAMAEEVPEEELSPEAAEETNTADPPPAPSPAPQPQRPRAREPDFDPNSIADLLNTDSKTGRRQQPGTRGDRTQQGVGLGTAERVTVETRAAALVRAHMRRCWRRPVDLPDFERLQVTIEFELNRNGTLNGQPRVTRPTNYTFDAPMRAAVDAALRAVRQCDPYPLPDDPVVGEHYEVWRTQIYNFDPSR